MSKQDKPIDEMQHREENTLPDYLERVINNIPHGGDDGIVYAGDYGWVCEYPNGNKELLEELTGLAGTLRKHGRDKFGKPIEPGTVLSTNLDRKTLELLDNDNLKLLGGPLGITEGTRKEIIEKLIEKLQIK